MSIDIMAIRSKFPMLHTEVYNKPLIYLDSAATTLKPQEVITTLQNHYQHECSNIHRGLHYFSELGTKKYEETRQLVAKLINAKHSEEIIFTRGTTESINLVAHTFAQRFLKPEDEIIISLMEHHSNIVPWQMVAERYKCKVHFIKLTDNFEIDLEHFQSLLNSKTKIVSVNHISNTLGTINPIKKIIELAHQAGAKCVIDAAQSVAHETIDVQQLDADFLVFSGHKMYAPTGIGVLYGKQDLLNELPPYQGGGAMIDQVTVEKTTYNQLPHKFEAGTPNIAATIALGTAINFMLEVGLEQIKLHETELLNHAFKRIKNLTGYEFYGPADENLRAATFCFNHQDAHSSDIGMFMDKRGFAIRTGHHCTQPLWRELNKNGAARASFAIYNTIEEVDNFFDTLDDIKDFF